MSYRGCRQALVLLLSKNPHSRTFWLPPKKHALTRLIANGWYVGVNVTSSLSNPPRHVKTTMKIKGDPGYAGASSACIPLSFLSDALV